jgi:predicted kinase
MKNFKQYLSEAKPQFTLEEAEEIGTSVGANFNDILIEEFRRGLEYESICTKSSVRQIGKNILDNLEESAQYYTHLQVLQEKTFEQYLTEAQLLLETLIMYNNGAKSGQAVFIIGGGASGKSFAVEKFIDSSSFKTLNVDDLKDNFIAWNKKTKKYPEWLDYNARDPRQVASLHQFIKDKGWDKKVRNSVLYDKTSSELKNVMFDIAVSNKASLQKKINLALQAGYAPKNIHITWVLANFKIALKRNRTRGRYVPENILLQAHKNSANIMNTILHNTLPDGVDGSVTVLLNNENETIYYPGESIKRTATGKPIEQRDKNGKIKLDANGNVVYKMNKTVKDFSYVTLKKPGKPILASNKRELELKKTVYKWMQQNVPEVLIKSDEWLDEPKK